MIGVRLRAAVLAAVLAAGGVSVQAQQLYRWTDENGKVHVTDTPPPPSAKNVQKPKAAAGAPSSGAVTDSFPLTQAMKDFPVTLYTAPSCKEPCSDARDALNRRGVPFKEIQIWDNASREELNKLAGTTNVPVLLVGRSVQKGFNPEAFDALLDAALYPRAGLLPPRNQAAPKPPADYVEPGQVTAKPAAKAEEEPAPRGPYAPRPPK
jgi:glutaredoxin